MRHKEKQFSLLKRSECLAKFTGGDISHPKASENECKNVYIIMNHRNNTVSEILSCVFLTCHFLSATVFAAHTSPPASYTCLFTSSTIMIDGRLDEPAWEMTPILSFFVPPDSHPPLSKTEGRLLWDVNYLYVGFRAWDKDIIGTFTKRDSPTWKEDVLEVFLMPDKGKGIYYNFEISPIGTIYDGRNGAGITLEKQGEWDCSGLRVKVTIHGTLNKHDDLDDLWEMEIAIPWEALEASGGKAPRAGDVWRFHLARYDYSVSLPGGKELSSCAPLRKVSFHNHDNWLRLIYSSQGAN